MHRLGLFLIPLCAAGRAAGACDPQHNHCLDARTWFLTEAVYLDSATLAVPAYEKDGRWISYEGEDVMSELETTHAFRTEVASARSTKKGDILIVWRPRDGEPRFPASEHAARTLHRWQAVIVETVNPAAGTFTARARDSLAMPLDAARTVVEDRKLNP